MVGPVTRASAAYLQQSPTATQRAPQSSFAERLEGAVGRVEQAQTGADALLKELASAEQVDLHGTMIALEKADISLRAMVSVRDKCIAAYEQVMNMAI